MGYGIISTRLFVITQPSVSVCVNKQQRPTIGTSKASHIVLVQHGRPPGCISPTQRPQQPGDALVKRKTSINSWPGRLRSRHGVPGTISPPRGTTPAAVGYRSTLPGRHPPSTTFSGTRTQPDDEPSQKQPIGATHRTGRTTGFQHLNNDTTTTTRPRQQPARSSTPKATRSSMDHRLFRNKNAGQPPYPTETSPVLHAGPPRLQKRIQPAH